MFVKQQDRIGPRLLLQYKTSYGHLASRKKPRERNNCMKGFYISWWLKKIA